MRKVSKSPQMPGKSKWGQGAVNRRTFNFKKGAGSNVVTETPKMLRSRKKTMNKRREKSYHTSRHSNRIIYQKNSTSIDTSKPKTGRNLNRNKRTLHNGKSLHHIKRRRDQ